MSQYPDAPESEISDERRFRVEQQGRILGAVHIVFGVLSALVGLFFTTYIILGVVVLVGAFPPPPPGQTPMDPLAFGGLFITIGVVFFIAFEALAVVLVYAGMSFIRMRNHVFLLVVQALNLLNQPMGLILAIFSGMYLLNDDVQAMFEQAKAERA